MKSLVDTCIVYIKDNNIKYNDEVLTQDCIDLIVNYNEPCIFSHLNDVDIIEKMNEISSESDSRAHIFARNYNFMRIFSGYGGLAFT
jgi:hypothetical protein